MQKTKLTLFVACTLMLALFSCETNDDEVQPVAAPMANDTTGTNGTTSIPRNSIVDNGDTIQLIQSFTVSPINSGSSNEDIKFEFFADLVAGVKGYWVLGIHEIPTASASLESSFTYHWQNLPQGKFYFNSIQDKNGIQWWYTKSETINMDVTIDGDLVTFSCANIEVGDSFLPQNVTTTKTVSTSVTLKLSDIQNYLDGNTNGTLTLVP